MGGVIVGHLGMWMEWMLPNSVDSVATICNSLAWLIIH